MVCIRRKSCDDVFSELFRLGVLFIIGNKANDIVHITQEAEQFVAVGDVVESAVVINRLVELVFIIHTNTDRICGGARGPHGDTYNLSEDQGKASEVTCVNVKWCDMELALKQFEMEHWPALVARPI